MADVSNAKHIAHDQAVPVTTNQNSGVISIRYLATSLIDKTLKRLADRGPALLNSLVVLHPEHARILSIGS